MEYCAFCGHPLDAAQKFCPNCGTSNPGFVEPAPAAPVYPAPEGYGSLDQQYAPYGYAEPVRETPHGTNGLAIAGFACAFMAPIVGLILSIIAGKRADSGEYSNPLPGLAKWGKIVSIIGIILGAICITVYVLVLIYAVREGGNIDWSEMEDLFDSMSISF